MNNSTDYSAHIPEAIQFFKDFPDEEKYVIPHDDDRWAPHIGPTFIYWRHELLDND